MANPPSDYKDPYWTNLSRMMEKKHGLPSGLLVNIVQKGEKTNNDRVSPVGAKTVYQIMPNTRSLFLKKYGVDAFESPQAAAEVAALHLKESLQRNKGNVGVAVREYHGGPNRAGWGKVNDAYVGRVLGGNSKASWSDIEKQVGKSSVPQRRDTKSEIDALLKAYDSSKAKTAQAQKPKSAGLTVDKLLNAYDERKEQSMSEDARNLRNFDYAEPTAPQEKPELSLGQKALGAIETGLTLGTGAVGGLLGTAGGAIYGIGENILEGTHGTAEGGRNAAMRASQGAEALTYAPRSQGGQRAVQAVGEFAEDTGLNALPPTLGGGIGTTAATLGRSSLPAANVAAREVAQAVKPVATQAVDAVKSGASKLGIGNNQQPLANMGAAQVDDATRRVTMANELPVPLGKLHSEGTATRDPYQLKFESETAKTEAGAPIINRVEERHAGVIQNMDAFNESTGAQLNDKYKVGEAVSGALKKEYLADKNKTKAAYAAADKSEESKAVVDLNRTVSGVIEGEDTNLANYLNGTVEGATETIIPTARKLAVHHGLADEVDGVLMPKPATIKQLENFRKDITAKTNDKEGADMRQAAIIKGLVDGHTEPFEGTLYKKARQARIDQAKRWERNSILDKIMGTKRNSDDRNLALEDVVDGIIKKGSIDDVNLVRKTLLSSGDEGKQAFSELQGALLRDIQEAATKGVAPDANGQQMVSPSALNTAINKVDDKLDLILGKQAADKVRLLNDVSKDLLTLPASTAANTSNTASAIAAMFDATSMLGAGVPIPVASALKVATSHLKNRKLKQRVEKALNLEKSLSGKF